MASKENQLSLVLFQGVPTENVSAHHDSATQVTIPAEEVVTRERNTDTAPGRENEATSPGRDSSDQTRYRYPEVVVWTHPRNSGGGNADATTSRPPAPTERPERPASDDIVVVEEVPSESGSSTFSERRRRRRRERALEYRRQRRHRLQENSDGEDNATDVNSDSGSDVVPSPPRPAQVRPQDRRTNTNSSSQAAQTNPAGRDISAGIESSRFSIAAIRRALRRMLHLPPPPYDPEAGQVAEGSDDDDDPSLLSTRSETWKHAILHSLLPDGFRITHDRDSWVNVRDVTLRYLNAATGNVTYGELLNAIYDGGALPRPPQEHGHSRAHLDDLRSLLFAMNVWNRGRVYDFRWTQSSLSDRAALPICGTSPTTLRVRPPRSVGGRSVDSHGTARGGDVATFSADDLDIASLREFGRIHIEWTDNIEDHLELVPCGSADEDLSEDSDDSDDESEEDTFLRRERKRRSRNRGMTLRIFWFETMEIKWLAKHLSSAYPRTEDAHVLACEVICSWSFLFHHRKDSRHRRAQQAYQRLPLPRYVADSLRARYSEDDEDIAWDTCGDVLDFAPEVTVYEMGKHLHPKLRQENKSLDGEYAYDLFPHFAARIVKLRRYMDRRKPRGWRQLYRDNRDSLSYYTFWAVIFFGSLSLVLALLSTVTGIVQAWASVKALQQSGGA